MWITVADTNIVISKIGLFHRVIAQSGTDMNFWSFNYPESSPETYTQKVAQNVNCPTEDSFEMMDCLRGVEQWMLKNNSGFSCTVTRQLNSRQNHAWCVRSHFCTAKAILGRGQPGLMR